MPGIAWPASGSTGLVKAVPVLWAGTSSRQTASRARIEHWTVRLRNVLQEAWEG
jgi:hypothetical protein